MEARARAANQFFEWLFASSQSLRRRRRRSVLSPGLKLVAVPRDSRGFEVFVRPFREIETYVPLCECPREFSVTLRDVLCMGRRVGVGFGTIRFLKPATHTLVFTECALDHLVTIKKRWWRARRGKTSPKRGTRAGAGAAARSFAATGA
jgi:hypothetical protein